MDKEQLAKYLSELDENVLQVAIMYSINYLAYGVDVTEKWDTAARQQDALYRAKCAGYYEGRSSIVRCKDCDNKECWGRAGDVVCGIDGTPHRPDWFCADGVAKDINVPDKEGR